RHGEIGDELVEADAKSLNALPIRLEAGVLPSFAMREGNIGVDVAGEFLQREGRNIVEIARMDRELANREIGGVERERALYRNRADCDIEAVKSKAAS